MPDADDPTYRCRPCNHQFSCRSSYRFHLKTIHQMKLERLRKSRPKLKAQPNITPVVDDPNRNCRSCNYQFSGKRNYRRHLMTAHEMKLEPLRKSKPKLKPQLGVSPVVDDPNHNCRSCNYQFTNKYNYRLHLINIHKMKPEVLNIMPKLKGQPSITPVVDDPNNNCRSCNHQFTSKRNYRCHLMTAHKMKLEPLPRGKHKLKPQPDISPVIDDPNHNCRSCNYQFSCRSSYRHHLKTAHQLKLEPLRKSRTILKTQPNITPAVDDPNNNCRSCNHQFTSRQNYRFHLRNVHKMKLEPLENSKPKLKPQPDISPVFDDPNYNCRSCNYQFARKDTYRRHLMTLHKLKLEP